MHKPSKDFSRVGWAFSAFTLSTYIIVLPLTLLLISVGSSFLSSSDLETALLIVAQSATYIVGTTIIYFFLRLPDHEKNPIPKIKIRASEILKLFCMGYLLIFLGNLISQGMISSVSQYSGEDIGNVLDEVLASIDVGAVFLVTVILAPIFEEIFCRKLLIDRIIKHGELAAIFTSGLVFGLFHGNLQQFVYAFITGMFLAYVYIRSGSLLYCIILHGMINFLGSIAIFVMPFIDSNTLDYLSTLPEDMDNQMAIEIFTSPEVLSIVGIFLFIGLLIITILFLGLIFWIISFRKLFIKETEMDLSFGGFIKHGILNAGMVIFIVLSISQILYQLGLIDLSFLGIF